MYAIKNNNNFIKSKSHTKKIYKIKMNRMVVEWDRSGGVVINLEGSSVGFRRASAPPPPPPPVAAFALSQLNPTTPTPLLSQPQVYYFVLVLRNTLAFPYFDSIPLPPLFNLLLPLALLYLFGFYFYAYANNMFRNYDCYYLYGSASAPNTLRYRSKP